jgi:DNA-binding NarL/FixJ family response regulator
LAAVRYADNEQAADALGCSSATVRSYWRRIFEKTGHTRARDVMAELFRFALTDRGPVGRAVETLFF